MTFKEIYNIKTVEYDAYFYFASFMNMHWLNGLHSVEVTTKLEPTWNGFWHSEYVKVLANCYLCLCYFYS